jgi:hypothetical protein
VRKQIVIRGPTNAAEFDWWKIDYDSGVDGWTVEDNLQKVIPPPPTALAASRSGAQRSQSGDQKKVQVKPEEGCGMPDPRAFREIPK